MFIKIKNIYVNNNKKHLKSDICFYDSEESYLLNERNIIKVITLQIFSDEFNKYFSKSNDNNIESDILNFFETNPRYSKFR